MQHDQSAARGVRAAVGHADPHTPGCACQQPTGAGVRPPARVPVRTARPPRTQALVRSRHDVLVENSRNRTRRSRERAERSTLRVGGTSNRAEGRGRTSAPVAGRARYASVFRGLPRGPGVGGRNRPSRRSAGGTRAMTDRKYGIQTVAIHAASRPTRRPVRSFRPCTSRRRITSARPRAAPPSSRARRRRSFTAAGRIPPSPRSRRASPPSSRPKRRWPPRAAWPPSPPPSSPSSRLATTSSRRARSIEHDAPVHDAARGARIETTFVDGTDPRRRAGDQADHEAVLPRNARQSRPRLVRSRSGRGHCPRAGITTICDNTFATPINQRPLRSASTPWCTAPRSTSAGTATRWGGSSPGASRSCSGAAPSPCAISAASWRRSTPT